MFKFLICSLFFLTLGLSSARAELVNTCYPFINRFFDEANKYIYQAENWVNNKSDNYVNMLDFTLGSNQFGVVGDASLGRLKSPPITCDQMKQAFNGDFPSGNEILPNGMQDIGFSPKYSVVVKIFSKPVEVVRVMMDASQKGSGNNDANKGKVKFGVYLLGMKINQKSKDGPDTKHPNPNIHNNPGFGSNPNAALSKPAQDTKGTAGKILDINRAIFEDPMTRPQIPIIPGILKVEFNAGVVFQINLAISYGVNSDLLSALGMNFSKTWTPGMNGQEIKECESETSCQSKIAKPQEKDASFWAKLGQATGVSDVSQQFNNLKKDYYALREKNLRKDVQLFKASLGDQYETFKNAQTNEDKANILKNIDLEATMRPLEDYKEIAQGTMDHVSGIVSSGTQVIEQAEQLKKMFSGGKIPAAEAYVNLGVSARATVWATAVLSLGIPMAKAYAGLKGVLNIIDANAGVAAKVKTTSQYLDLEANVQWVLMSGLLQLIYGVEVDLGFYKDSWEGSKDLVTFPGFPFKWKTLLARVDFRPQNQSPFAWCWDPSSSQYMDKRCYDGDQNMDDQLAAMSAHEEFIEKFLGEELPPLSTNASAYLVDAGISVMPLSGTSQLQAGDYEKIYLLKPDFFISSLVTGMGKTAGPYNLNISRPMHVMTSSGFSQLAPLQKSVQITRTLDPDSGIWSFTATGSSNLTPAAANEPYMPQSLNYDESNLIDLGLVSNSPICGGNSNNPSRSNGAGFNCSQMDGLVKLKDLLYLSSHELGCLAKDSRLGMCQVALENEVPVVYIGASKYQGQDAADSKDKTSQCFSSSVTDHQEMVGCHLRRALVEGACFPASRLAQFMAIARQSDDDILAMFTAQGSEKKISGQHALTTPSSDWSSYESKIHSQDDYFRRCLGADFNSLKNNYNPTQKVKDKFIPSFLNSSFANAYATSLEDPADFGVAPPPPTQISPSSLGFVQFLVQLSTWRGSGDGPGDGSNDCYDGSSWRSYKGKYAHHAIFSKANIKHVVRGQTPSQDFPSICKINQYLDATQVRLYLYTNPSRQESQLKQAIINKAQIDANGVFGTNYSPSGDFSQISQLPIDAKDNFLAGIKQCINAGSCKVASVSTELDQSSLASGQCQLSIGTNINESLGTGTDLNQCAAFVGDINLLCNSKRSSFAGNSGAFSADVRVEFRRGSDPVEQMVVGKCTGSFNASNGAISVFGTKVDISSPSSSSCQIWAGSGIITGLVNTPYNFDYPTTAEGCVNQIEADLFEANICKNVPGNVLYAAKSNSGSSANFSVNIFAKLGSSIGTPSKTCVFSQTDAEVISKINRQSCSISFTQFNPLNQNVFKPAESIACETALSPYFSGTTLNCDRLSHMNEFRATSTTQSQVFVIINRPNQNHISGYCGRPVDNYSTKCRYLPLVELEPTGNRLYIPIHQPGQTANSNFENLTSPIRLLNGAQDPTTAQSCVESIKNSNDINPWVYFSLPPRQSADAFCLSILHQTPVSFFNSFIPNWNSGGYRGAVSPLGSSNYFYLRITPDAMFQGQQLPTGIGCDLALVRAQKPDTAGGSNYKWDIALASMAPLLNDQRNDANNVDGRNCLKVKTSVARDASESPLQGPWCGVIQDNPVANLSQIMLGQQPSSSSASYALSGDTCFTYKCAEFSVGEKLIFAGTGPQLLRIKSQSDPVDQQTICSEIKDEISPLSDLDTLPASLPPEAKRRPVWIYSATKPNEAVNLNQLKSAPPAFGCGVETCGIKFGVGSNSDLGQTYGQVFEDEFKELLYANRDLSFANAQSCFDYHLGKKNTDGSVATLGSLSSICSIIQQLDYVPDNLPIEVSVAYGSLKKPVGSCQPIPGNQKTCEIGYNAGGTFSSYVLLNTLPAGIVPVSTSLPGGSTIWLDEENTLERCLEKAMSSIDCSKVPQDSFGSSGEVEFITKFGESEVSLGMRCLVKPGVPEFNEVDKESCNHYLRMPEPSPQGASYFVEVCFLDNCSEQNFTSGFGKIVQPSQAVEFNLPLMIGNDAQIRAYFGQRLGAGMTSLKSRVRSFNSIASSGWTYFDLPILSNDSTIKASCLKRWSVGAVVNPGVKEGFVQVEPSKEFCGAILTLPKKVEDPDSIVVLNDDSATILMCLEKECKDEQVIWKFEASRAEPFKLNFLEYLEKNGGSEKLAESLNRGNTSVFGRVMINEKWQIFEIPVLSLNEEMTKKCKEVWGVKLIDEKETKDGLVDEKEIKEAAPTEKELFINDKEEMILEENSAILEE